MDYAAGTVTTIQSCSPAGMTQAICSTTAITRGAGKPTITSGITTIRDRVYGQVPIHTGANKLQGLAACAIITGGAALATRGSVEQVYKVLVPGAAASLAGALVLDILAGMDT